MTYDPNDWYWRADDGRVFASARQQTVDESDADYLAFSERQMPSQWPRDDAGEQTDAALQEVLAPYNIFVTLEAYTLFKRWQTETGGITVTIPAGPMPIKSDDRAQANINGQRLKAQADSAFTTKWHAADHTIHPLTATDMISVSNQLQTHVTNCFNTSATVLAGIASGSITTHAQIDDAFAAISNV